MKTNTIKQKNKSVLHSMLLYGLFVLAGTATQAQVQTNGSLFVGNGGTFFVGSGDYAFGTGGTSSTTRGASYGKFVFGPTATTSGASSAHFLDGYASRSSATAFVFPLGRVTNYAPIKLLPSSASTIDAIYLRATPRTPYPTLDASVGAISNQEYWNIIGTNNAVITLSWRFNSNLVADIGIATSTANLTIVGYDGSKWVTIPSTVDSTPLVGTSSSITGTGSITSTAAVNLSTYQFFTLGREVASCAPIVASSGVTKTWNGSWSPSAPTIADPVVINAAYAAGSFACNSLVLNADITLTNGQNVEIVNGVTTSGGFKIVMASEASVVQRQTGVSAPNIVLTKRTRTTMRLNDYIYWGTPIAGNFYAQLANAMAASGATLADAFDAKIKYVSGTGLGLAGGWQNLGAVTTGQGFATRIKNQAPFINTIATNFINLTFTGVANNGNITVPITNDTSALTGGRSHVFLANPYPSALDADKFITENTTIDGAVYIWSAATLNPGAGAAYSQADYITYSLAGSVVPGGIANSFNGKIASGQGFLVRSLVNSGSVLFNNCMRLTAENNQFYKVKDTKATAINDSYKLNLTGDNGVFSQILVAYMPTATLGYDRMYDATRNSVAAAQLFSILENDGSKLAINARPSFAADDIVPIGVTKTSTFPETFTIALAEKVGVFNTADQSVYIHDTQNNTYFDLNNGDFMFTTANNELDRYKVVYTAGTLSNPKFENNGVFATLNNNVIALQSSLPITGIEVYDLAGRRILESKINNTLSSTTSFLFPKAVYIVKAKLNNGTVASFKLINKN